MLKINISIKRSDFHLDIKENLPTCGVTAIYGHSGSGKTTILRCIAGLERQGNGDIIFNDNIWQSGKNILATNKRPLAYIFQEPSLFEHLTVQDNLNYAIKRSSSKPLFDYNILIKLLGIENILKRFPKNLSGGEKQRVAFARALLINPKLILMDEPLSSLDPTKKRELLPYIETLKNEFNIPIIYVSHSPEEIARLADYLLILENGKVIESGSSEHILSKINSTESTTNIQEYTGNIIQATIKEKDNKWSLAKAQTGDNFLWVKDNNYMLEQKIRLRIFPSDVGISTKEQHNSSILNSLKAEVVEIYNESNSPTTLIKLKLSENFIIARISQRSTHMLNIKKQQIVWALIKSVAIV